MDIPGNSLEDFLKNTEKLNYAVALFSEPGDSFFHLFAQSLENQYTHDIPEKFILKSFHPATGYPDIVIAPEINKTFALTDFPEEKTASPFSTWKGMGDPPQPTSQAMYEQGVENVKHQFRSSGIRKAMLSAVRAFPFPVGFSVTAYLKKLKQLYPNTFISFTSTPFSGTWIGATPEILVKREANLLETISLAGTRISGSGVPWSEKEMDEQEWVSLHIREILSPQGNLSVFGPEDFHTGNLVHLRTIFHLESAATLLEKNWESIATALHPTPAVGGYPKEEAITLITANEAHNRSYYAGYMGLNTPQKTFLYVNLRCMKIFPDHLFIFTGAGITEGSDAASEWAETAYKAQILLKALDT